ncbi:MAG: hypothetical protein ACLSA6_07225 [Holdemania massiliensis]
MTLKDNDVIRIPQLQSTSRISINTDTEQLPCSWGIERQAQEVVTIGRGTVFSSWKI